MDSDPGALVRRTMDAYNRRDMAALESLVTPAVVWRPSMTGGDTGYGESFVGIEGLRAFFAAIDETWRALSTEGAEIEVLEEGRVLVAYTLRGVGRASGIELSRPVWSAVRLAGGRIDSMFVFNSREEAVDHLDSGLPRRG